MTRVVCQIVPIAAIDEVTARAMYALFERFYVDVSWERFLGDLREKSCVLLLRQAGGRRRPGPIVGFSTVLRTRVAGAPKAHLLFSGDTIVDPSCWRERPLEKAFVRLMLREKLRNPTRPLYWMLMSKGFATYRLLRTSFRRGYPRPGAETPEALGRVLAEFYGARYGAAFDPRRGVVAFPERHGALRPGIAASPTRRLDDPDARFFVERNPGWARGDELACIAEIRWIDFGRFVRTAFLHRFATRARRRRPRAGAGVAA
jgi:hypothetical protein